MFLVVVFFGQIVRLDAFSERIALALAQQNKFANLKPPESQSFGQTNCYISSNNNNNNDDDHAHDHNVKVADN